jgi:outer membrane murein-binding lipoprotein Lpp
MRAAFAAVGCAFALAGCCPEYAATRARAPIKTIAAKPGVSEMDRARASQAERCAQRHIDRAKGTLSETEEQKRARDEICGAYYRGS